MLQSIIVTLEMTPGSQLVKLKDEGTMILWNFGGCSPSDTVSCPRRLAFWV